MPYEFYIGQFPYGEGIQHALDRGIEAVIGFATRETFKHSRAFSAGGHQLHGGSKWAKLAPSTIKRKGHATILVDKGILRESIYFKVIRALPGTFVVDIGTNTPYAKHHQDGGPHLPQRKVIDVTLEDANELVEDVAIWAELALNGPFRSRLGGTFNPHRGAA